ncbi:MAG: hypothetical protein ACREM2_00245 [Vulcanimicrobiaceae bacterium]
MSDRGILYVDTSVLLKRYIWELDSHAAGELMRAHELAISAFSEVELRSALHRARRREVLGPRALESALVSSAVLRRAGDIVAVQALRAAEALGLRAPPAG